MILVDQTLILAGKKDFNPDSCLDMSFEQSKSYHKLIRQNEVLKCGERGFTIEMGKRMMNIIIYLLLSLALCLIRAGFGF